MKHMNKKFVISVLFVIGLVMLMGNSAVSAQTGSQNSKTLIQQLQNQIAQLKNQIEALRAAQSAVLETRGEIKDTVTLIRELREGMIGDDVRVLQALLAADSDVYPEGLITGYYGRLTAQAVRKFQKKAGLPAVGHVGPKTLEKIKEQHTKTPVELEDSDDPSEGKRLCAKVPPGHLIAPGWLRKNDGKRPIVPQCQILPHGIQKKLDGGGVSTSTPPDLTAPVISGLVASSTTTSSAHVLWNTNEPATSAIWYSSSTPIVSDNALSASNATLTTSHDLALTGLVASTTHYYYVRSVDSSGNTATTSEQSFVTLP